MAGETIQQDPQRWHPLGRIERRAVGVLIEKAKTTPDNYPLTLNSLVNGCNQKSNRSPQMQLDEEQVYDALEVLRKEGAVSQIQGDGRAEKYRHLMYEWLGVDKVELAVMAELLLRGAQTLGELRGRAARMEPIKGISELQPIVENLRQKGLLQYLTPPGRGCVVTHCLYEERELEKLRNEFGSAQDSSPPNVSASAPAAASVPTSISASATQPAGSAPAGGSSDVSELKSEVAALRRQLTELEERIADFDQVRDTVADLRRQLGA